jgi:hypothetical protein
VERTAVEVIASDFTFHSPKQEVAAAEAATTPEPENNHESHSEQYPGNAGVIPSVA